MKRGKLPVSRAPHPVATGKSPADHTVDKETESSLNSRPPLKHSPMSSATVSRNNFIDPQSSSLKFKEESLEQKMDPRDQNYALAPSSYQSVFSGSLVPRSAIPRTVDPEVNASTLLTLFPDALKDLSNAEISKKVADSHRYRNIAYAQEPVTMRPEAQRAERAASKQPSQTNALLHSQNAQAAEARQHQPRIQVPDRNDNEEVEDDQGSSSNEDLSSPHGCRQH